MDKHGNKDWLGPLLEKLGPCLQVQIADLANLLEVYDNFVHFRRPRYAFYSVFLFFALFLLVACASIQFTMNVFQFVVVLVLFGCWPISSLYPRYRLLVSPLKLAFSEIPTYPEWALRYLQDRGSSTLEEIRSYLSENLHDRIDSSEVVAQGIGDHIISSRVEKHLPTLSSKNMHGGYKIFYHSVTLSTTSQDIS